jgi:hypothetical protein
MTPSSCAAFSCIGHPDAVTPWCFNLLELAAGQPGEAVGSGGHSSAGHNGGTFGVATRLQLR